MTESQIIWKYLSRLLPDDHHVIYIYCCGLKNNKQNIKKIIFDSIYPIFGNAIPNKLINSTILKYLNFKNTQYINGEITLKSIY